MKGRKTLITLAASTALLGGSILVGSIATGQGANELSRPVTITNTPLPVVNDGTNPLLIKDTELAARQPVLQNCRATYGTGPLYEAFTQCYFVPGSKRLVIEQVSFRTVVNAASNVEGVAIQVNGGSGNAFHLAPLKYSSSFVGNKSEWVSEEHVTIYAGPGDVILAFAIANGTDSNDRIEFTLAGHLVNLP